VTVTTDTIINQNTLQPDVVTMQLEKKVALPPVA
jgi:hypothetical protein